MGRHYLLNLYGCPFNLLDDEQYVVNMLTAAALMCGATILNTASHKFEPYGVTAILMLAESHCSFHSWPQDGSAAVDIYTCSDVDPYVGCVHIIEEIKSTNHELRFVQR